MNHEFSNQRVMIAPSSVKLSEEILTPQAISFLVDLERRFRGRRHELLADRAARQDAFDAGERPDFLASTEHVRNAEWRIDPVPGDLHDRRVEITGPVDRKMVINALNSGANVFMADFEDSTSPTWDNVVAGQVNLRDAVRGTISFENANGKQYVLAPETATLVVRPRGFHLEENHVLIDGARCSASLFDFGLFFFHNAHNLIANGTGPYFYLPKLESHLEARLWNDIFVEAQRLLNIPLGTIKATVLIETITAAFEMDEILFELRNHSAGLNCGRWDYIFSVIKKFRHDRMFVLPDRAAVTMETHFLRSYSRLLIKTCHRRGAHAIGGMAAQIPIKNDASANEAAMNKVRNDKLREVQDGHDGTWVAHPGLVPVAREIFDRHMESVHQLHITLDDVTVGTADLLEVPSGPITEKGLRTNLRVAVQYTAAWLDGVGCAAINHLMEDAATAEISRAQVWQWIRHAGIHLEDGREINRELCLAWLDEEVNALSTTVDSSNLADASDLVRRLITGGDFADFLTLPAYEQITTEFPSNTQPSEV